MRLRKSVVASIISFIGILLCAGNLWFTAERSTIPVSLETRLVDKQIGREKHPGADDVYWLILEDGGKLHVDRHVYNAVKAGEGLQKSSWSKELRHGGQTLPLEWSPDTRGMLPVMALGVGILLLLTVAIRKGKRS